jgi:dihydroorotase
VTGEIHPAVRKAIDRGVRVDVGHGSHFSFEMARLALAQGIMPDTLGADLHGYNITVPVEGAHDEALWKNPFADVAPFSLAIAMTELMMLGLKFPDVVAMVTCNAAEMIGMSDTLGTLKRGRAADVTVIDRVPGAWELRDNSRVVETADEIVVPRFVLKDGERFEPDSPLLPAPVEASRKAA